MNSHPEDRAILNYYAPNRRNDPMDVDQVKLSMFQVLDGIHSLMACEPDLSSEEHHAWLLGFAGAMKNSAAVMEMLVERFPDAPPAR